MTTIQQQEHGTTDDDESLKALISRECKEETLDDFLTMFESSRTMDTHHASAAGMTAATSHQDPASSGANATRSENACSPAAPRTSESAVSLLRSFIDGPDFHTMMTQKLANAEKSSESGGNDDASSADKTALPQECRFSKARCESPPLTAARACAAMKRVGEGKPDDDDVEYDEDGVEVVRVAEDAATRNDIVDLLFDNSESQQQQQEMHAETETETTAATAVSAQSLGRSPEGCGSSQRRSHSTLVQFDNFVDDDDLVVAGMPGAKATAKSAAAPNDEEEEEGVAAQQQQAEAGQEEGIAPFSLDEEYDYDANRGGVSRKEVPPTGS